MPKKPRYAPPKPGEILHVPGLGFFVAFYPGLSEGKYILVSLEDGTALGSRRADSSWDCGCQPEDVYGGITNQGKAKIERL